jgi:hypothetical protein
MAPATAGDPMTGLKWTRKTTVKVSEELRKLDIEVGPRTVARLLDDLNYRLRVNHKKLSRGSARTRTQRNLQFLYIESMRQSFTSRGLPVISVDTKRITTSAATPASSLPHTESSTPSPTAATSSSEPPTTHRPSRPTASRAGGRRMAAPTTQRPTRCSSSLTLAAANGSRCRAWKHGLATKLCQPNGLQATVCHYPPGASKWNHCLGILLYGLSPALLRS